MKKKIFGCIAILVIVITALILIFTVKKENLSSNAIKEQAVAEETVGYYNVYIETNEGITYRGDRQIQYQEGATVQMTFRADDGWKISDRTSVQFIGLNTGMNGFENGVIRFTMPASDVVIRLYAELISYTITYNLDGGTAEGNPETYTIRTQDFALNQPTKEGYIFLGWTGSNGTTPQTEVTIPAGTTRDLEYTANWTSTDTYEVNLIPRNGADITNLGGTNLNYAEGARVLLQLVGNGIWDNPYVVGITSNTGIITYETNTYEYKGKTCLEISFTMPASPVYIQLSAEKIAVYTVEHYKQNIDGTYPATATESETFEAKIGDTVTPEVKTYEGFTSPAVQSVELTEEGQVIRYEYERASFVVWMNHLGGGVKEQESKTYKYEEQVVIHLEVIEGYQLLNVYSSAADVEIHWTDKEVRFTMPAKGFGIETQTEPITYSITYNLDGGTAEGNPTTYTIESRDIVLNIPRKDGYTFMGWTGSNGEITPTGVAIITGTTGDLVFTAKWAPVTYHISYDLAGGTAEGNPREYTIETENIVLKQPTKEGYAFLGWTGSNGITPEKEVIIPKGTTGNLEYTANWTNSIKYTVEHYKQNIDETYPTTPTESETIEAKIGDTVTPEVKTYEGFTSPAVQSVELTEEGQVIRYEYERNTYKINIINGGDEGLKEPEKTEYKYEEEVLLKLELKKGYQNLNIDRSTVEYQWSDIENIVFTMPAADVEFEISSSIITYLITYNLNDGSHSGNPSTYTVEDTMTLNQPTKEGYIFLGWTGSNGTTPQKEVTIQKGTTGNLEYTANWRLQAVDYTVNHYLQEIDGTYPTSPNYTDTKQGEIGTEVKGTVNNYNGFTSPVEKQITIKQNANENIIEYQYARNSYNVEITKGEGIEQISGNGTYKYEEEVILSAEAKIGYGNIRWTGDKLSNKFYMPSNNVQISVSASLIEYEIKYNLNGGNIEGNQSNPSKYTIETEEFTLKNPTRVGYTFIGWTGSNGTTPQKEVIIPKGTIGNLEYTANWEVIPTDEPDDLEIEISYSTKELTNKDVTVIISANNKIEAIEGWILSEDGKSISKVYRENATETVTIIDEYDNQEKQTIEIDNIDKISPEITIKYEQRDNYVTVTATSNEELKEIEGWEISENKKQMKKLYYVNQKEEVSFFDLAGNETKKPIEIDSIKNNDDDDEPDEGNPNNPDGDDKGTIDSTGGNLSDPTTSNKELPAAGMQFIIGTGFAIIIAIGIISFVKVKKYNDIK